MKTNGARLEIPFPGLSMGLFSGQLQFTVFKETNLLRQVAIAQTDAPSVAYKYSGGLTGFSTETQRMRWRDIGGDWQKYEFGRSGHARLSITLDPGVARAASTSWPCRTFTPTAI